MPTTCFYACGVYVLFNLRIIIEDKKFAFNNSLLLELIGQFRETIKVEMMEKTNGYLMLDISIFMKNYFVYNTSHPGDRYSRP